MDLVEGDAVVPLVAVVDVRDFNMRHNAGYKLGNFGQAMVEVVVADVEDLAGHDRGFSFHAHHKCARRVPDVQERSPLLTVEDGDLTGSGRPSGQQIDHQVKPWAWRESEQRPQPKNSGVKVARSHIEQQFFRVHLCLRVRGDRGRRGELVHQKLGRPVYAAT